MQENEKIKNDKIKFKFFTTAILVLSFFIAFASLYLYFKVDFVQKNIELTNRFHFKSLKHLNQIVGSWNIYQKQFDAYVAFKSKNTQISNLLYEDLEKLEAIGKEYHDFKLQSVIAEIKNSLDKDKKLISLIDEAIKNKKINEIAEKYHEQKLEHHQILNNLYSLISNIENDLAQKQFNAEKEMQLIQIYFFIWLFISLGFTLFVLIQFKRWFTPVLEWIEVAKVIAKGGLKENFRFPKISSSVPKEIAILTSEFRRMALSIIDREKTIQAQNERLKAQKDKLLELMDAEAKLQHTKKMILAGNMTSQIAHEVKNPLHSMSLQCELLLEEVHSDEAIKRIEILQSEIERLERITNHYLNVTKKTIKTKTESISVHELIERVLTVMKDQIQIHSIEVILDLKANFDKILGDPDAIMQVLVNLIKNSIEALNLKTRDKKILIRTQNDFKNVKIYIEDSGCGVSSDIVLKLFEPFFTSKTQGHGLGLSISRQICHEHQGELRLLHAKASELGGACFEMILPLEQSLNLGGVYENLSR
jgi:signal transduction histidine kinase